MLLALKHKEYRQLDIVSTAVKAMSEGELLQIEKARRLDITEDVYYDIIRNKTASLIASACSAGASSATNDDAVIELMRLFGEKLGIAFQIRDDLFDFGSEDVGKPLGIDIKEKKMTLPLIYALQHAPKKDRRYIINIIKNHSENAEKVKEVINFVQQSGGLEYSQKAMNDYRDQAFQLLNTFPETTARESLKDLVAFITDRKR